MRHGERKSEGRVGSAPSLRRGYVCFPLVRPSSACMQLVRPAKSDALGEKPVSVCGGAGRRNRDRRLQVEFVSAHGKYAG